MPHLTPWYTYDTAVITCVCVFCSFTIFKWLAVVPIMCSVLFLYCNTQVLSYWNPMRVVTIFKDSNKCTVFFTKICWCHPFYYVVEELPPCLRGVIWLYFDTRWLHGGWVPCSPSDNGWGYAVGLFGCPLRSSVWFSVPSCWMRPTRGPCTQTLPSACWKRYDCVVLCCCPIREIIIAIWKIQPNMKEKNFKPL